MRNSVFAALILLIPGVSHAGLIYGYIFGATGGFVTIECVANETYRGPVSEDGFYEIHVPETDVFCSLIYLEGIAQVYSQREPIEYNFFYEEGVLIP